MFKQSLFVSIRMLAVIGLFLLPIMAHYAEAKKPQLEGQVNINTATIEQLRLLPRIGPKIAARIIEYRQKQQFTQPSDLTKVKGIGQKTFLRLQAHITTTAPTNIKQK
jgi:competence protein ComEA